MAQNILNLSDYKIFQTPIFEEIGKFCFACDQTFLERTVSFRYAQYAQFWCQPTSFQGS